jgi:hypothetical protein
MWRVSDLRAVRQFHKLQRETGPRCAEVGNQPFDSRNRLTKRQSLSFLKAK